MPTDVPGQVRDAVQRLKSKHQGTKPLLARLQKDPTAKRYVADETRDFWRSLVGALKVAPGAADRWARQIAANGGTDILTILAQVDARGVHGAAEYCWAWLATTPAARAGTAASTDVYAQFEVLEKTYHEMIAAYEAATEEPPYTLDKGKALERACDKLRKAGTLLIASSEGEAAQIRSCTAAADQWWSAYRGAVPWYGRSDSALVESHLKTLLSDSSMKNAMYLLPPRGWYDLAILRRNAERMFRELGSGSIRQNRDANVTGDATAKCHDRARLFGVNETIVDPFTNQRSNLPYGDVNKAGAGLSGRSNDWSLESADHCGKWYRADHHAVRFVWTGGYRAGVGNPKLEFVIDTWKGGEFLVCTFTKWRQTFPD